MVGKVDKNIREAMKKEFSNAKIDEYRDCMCDLVKKEIKQRTHLLKSGFNELMFKRT